VHESSREVPDGLTASTYRVAGQVTSDVIGEFARGRVPLIGILPQRLEYDGVEVSAQPAA